MSRRVKDLEVQVAVLEAQRDRVRPRLALLAKAARLVAHQTRYYGGIGRQVSKLLIQIGKDLDAVNHEYDRYYIEPKE